jgi:hypothetical protein
MKQKMTKLLSLALLIAMVLSLCVPTAFAELPVTEDKNYSITSYNKIPGTTDTTCTIVVTGLEEYNPTYEYTSTWFTLSGNVVTAAHSAIEYNENGSAIESHTDTVTVNYSKGEEKSSFEVNVNVTDNDAVVLNQELKELKNHGANGLLDVLKYLATYAINTDDSRENALLNKAGSAKALMDLIVMGLFIGQAVGRWGNFMNREAFGSETTLPWRMQLTTVSGNLVEVHPTFLYESLWNVVGLLLIVLVVSKARRFDGENTWFYFLWYGIGRFWIEGLRTDSLYLWGLKLFGQPVRVSQALSLVMILVAAFMLIYHIKLHPHSREELYVNRVAARDGAGEEEEAS